MSDYQLLLERVRLLYEKHEAGRRKPFNVFSVLRSPSDEVNLHSRFLHALLDYRKSPEAERENLKDFLQHVVKKEFEENGAKVERERYIERQRYKIDILISNADSKQAIVIENKIWAGDQPKQLQGYYEQLRDQEGYGDIHLLYLTPHGDEPSEDSVGGLPYKTISYKGDLPPWLERCQQRAYDEPRLRESVAQYRQLIPKLTGTDLTEAYMSELKNLLLRDNNLVLACDLSEAMREVRIKSLKKLWDEIESELKKKIPGLPHRGNASGTSLERISDFVRSHRYSKDHGLYYPFGSGSASLGVQVAERFFFGVYCSETRGRRREYNKLKNALHDVSGGDPWPDGWWPWHKYVNNGLNLKDPAHQETCEMLLNKEKRKKYAQEIADDLKKVWNRLNACRLAP